MSSPCFDRRLQLFRQAFRDAVPNPEDLADGNDRDRVARARAAAALPARPGATRSGWPHRERALPQRRFPGRRNHLGRQHYAFHRAPRRSADRRSAFQALRATLPV